MIGARAARCYRYRMTTPDCCDHEIDLHRLDLRYAGLRLADPRALERLRQSLERYGQREPCLAVALADCPQLVLLDGYRRVAALQRLGRDTVRVEARAVDLTTGLILALTRAQGRAWAAIEEAWWLQELTAVQGLSQQEVARHCGRDVSWVSRRLSLLHGLSEPLSQALRAGTLSLWSATRVLIPLARANADHAERLLKALSTHPLPTRTLRAWLARYRQARVRERERLVDHPRLFEAALASRAQERTETSLRDGPEGACLRDARALEAILTRLHNRLESLSGEPWPEGLRRALRHLAATLAREARTFTRYGPHDHPRDAHRDPHAEGPRGEPAPDRPSP
ncbi:ParB/RepB/Spo0J family partition protein [Acidiferrobacter thiooxydans]|uniref:ParB/RepB/Spo0J family partition protein n=1 Tax=Acidiferrobacter thiooxydans TaxID=163359 RepID=UPI0008564EFD|nr:ParB/RepB/Spo0J family partition protein [Acidiferrobacter thiooxydans]UEO00459.1 ParB/RepB/Spo0J family partition protein [Acidiferrobacter thiooxydans]